MDRQSRGAEGLREMPVAIAVIDVDPSSAICSFDFL